MKRFSLIVLLVGLISFIFVPNALANGVFFSKIPDGLKKDCTLCHVTPPILNEVGQKFKASNFDFAAIMENQKEPAPAPENQGSGEAASQGKQEPPAKENPQGAGAGSIQGNPGTAQEPAVNQGKQTASIQLVLPSGVTRGEKTKLTAKVTVNGQPLASKQVHFFEKTDFFGQTQVSLGTAATGPDGIAEISYWPSAATEDVTITASVDEDAQIKSGQASGTFAMAITGPLYSGETEAGLDIPFLGPWTIGLAAGAIWAMYFFVGYKALTIRKFGKATGQQVFQERKRSAEG